ncbi:MAG: phosphoenolpyruvate carboxylase, partial [Nannocystaceae bacterium]
MTGDPNDGDPLIEDIEWLTTCLRRVMQRLDPEGVSAAVGQLEAACRARRSGADGAPDLRDLLEQVRATPLEEAEKIVRAFTLYFLLVNTAEQVARIRHRRDPDHHSEGRLEDTWRALAAEGHSAEQIRQRITELEVRPVLTAHPTEATRKTLLALQARIADELLARRHAAPDEQSMHEAALEAEVE